jgi:hypothetical protein
MKRILLAAAAVLLLCQPAHSQVVSGTRRVLAWPSVTGTAALADTTSMVLIDGTTIGTRATTLTNLGVAVLSTQALVNSLTIKGTGLSISGTNGSLTLTGSAVTSATSGAASIFTLTFGGGTLTGAQTTTGVLTLSNLTLSTAGPTSSNNTVLTVVTTTTGNTILANLTGTSGLFAGRRSDGWSYLSSVPVTGTTNVYGIGFGAADSAIQIRFSGSRYCDFYSDNTAIAGMAPTGLIMYTGTTDLRNSGLRMTTLSLGTSGSITSSTTIETLTGGITRTLSITNQTGRIYWCYNQGATTSTLNGGGANINGASTQAILTGSSALLFSDGTNAWGIIK